MRKNILVSGASGVVGYGILRSLQKSGLDLSLVGTSIHTDTVASVFSHFFERAPKTSEDGYYDWLSSIIKKYNINMLIPGIEIDMLSWSRNRDFFKAHGVTVMLNNPDLISLCGDKWNFYQALGRDNPIAIPTCLETDFDTIVTKFGLPFLLKPRVGFASKGIVRIHDKDTFEKHKHLIGEILMVQPIVGTDDEEYTASAFFDSHSHLCCYQTLRRRLSNEGYTEKAYVTELNEINDAIRSLAEKLKPLGPTNFQFRKSKDGLKLLEINPRISSSTSIRTAFGYNESKMCVEYFLDGIEPTQPHCRKGYAIRYIEDYIHYEQEI